MDPKLAASKWYSLTNLDNWLVLSAWDAHVRTYLSQPYSGAPTERYESSMDSRQFAAIEDVADEELLLQFRIEGLGKDAVNTMS